MDKPRRGRPRKDQAVNGDGASLSPVGEAKPKRGRPRKAKEGPPPVAPVVAAKPPEPVKAIGRIASQIVSKKLEWMVKPWFPRAKLALVVGKSDVGKSTFFAWLTAQCGRTCILPGYEEEVESMTIPRLERNGCNLDDVKFLDEQHYCFPRDEKKVTAEMLAFKANVLIVDPLDSYLEDGASENDNQSVRGFLESLKKIAVATNALVIGVRHRGKSETNITPGSRAWYTVPRPIVMLQTDGAKRPRYSIVHIKPSGGRKVEPVEYFLDFVLDGPPRFRMGGAADRSITELATTADTATDRYNFKVACRLIRHLFEANANPQMQDLIAECRKYGVGDKSRADALRVLDIGYGPTEKGGKWMMWRNQKEWPSWLTLENQEGVSL